MANGAPYPRFKDLPIKPDAPANSAWGVFDKDGKKDVWGTLNKATPAAVVAAREEIKTGESVVLNLPMHLPHQKGGAAARQGLVHTFVADAHKRACCDDAIHIDTQASSQWDGLLHYANQKRREYYNGVSYEKAAHERSDKTLGIQCLSDRGGIIARGILIDYVRYAAMNNITYETLSNHAITLPVILEIIAEQNLEVRPGDVLLVRCGLGKWIRASTPDMLGASFDRGGFIGVDSSEEVLEWLWDSGFAAVAGDAIAWEAIPAPDGSIFRIHETLIPGWGMPIGELLDLEALAALAERLGRWSFFLTVCPLNVEGGAATLANTLAVF